MKKLRVALKFFPVILPAIKAAEEVVPAKGAGAQKLDFVLGVADQAYQAEQAIVEGVAREEFLSAVTLLVGHAVLRLNQTSQLQKAA